MGQDPTKLRGGYLTAHQSRQAHIVISGMSGKLPNSNSVHEFMERLYRSEDLCEYENVGDLLRHPEIPKAIGKLRDIEGFDNGFFGMHSFNAQNTDPMSRIMMEQVIAALLDAGISTDEIAGSRTGVFIGTCTSEYEMGIYKIKQPNSFLLPGTMRSIIAHSISYFLKVNGPSMICDTACSSSMYALDSAYRAILEGRCDRAIVGGSNLTRDSFLTLQFARLGVLNPGSGCRPFDRDACGYTRAEAILAIVLQKHCEAKRVYANVVHINCNSDGYKMQGITFPSSDGQIEVLNSVYKEANITPNQVGFVEAHGTGTIVGDPEELSVLESFFEPTVDQPLLIGSVKGNIGHTEPSAGLCAIIKVVSSLNTGKIAPNIHYASPREGVSALADGRLKVVTKTTRFPHDQDMAAINCFGFGGANSHLILEKSKKPKSEDDAWLHPRLVCYSGRNRKAIDLLHEQVQSSRDVEFLGLLQESFKVPLDNHLYRGFSVVGTQLRSIKMVQNYAPPELLVVFGTFSTLNILQNMLQIPLLCKIYKELEEQEKGLNLNIIMYVMMLKAFVALTLQPRVPNSENLSKQFEKCFANGLAMKEVIQVFNSRLFQSCHKSKDLSFDKNTTILVLGDVLELKSNSNMLHFSSNMTCNNFLVNIGRLYEEGFNPNISKLYDAITYPVSRGTDMISHLIEWKRNTFHLESYNKVFHAAPERNESLKCHEKPEVLFYRGHLIENRNLFPATGYLWHIWELFAESHNSHPHMFNVIFQNVRFHRACTITSKAIDLYMVIQRNGRFEISENKAIIVSGSIFEMTETECELESFENDTLPGNTQKIPLNSKDIYKELRLRGYNYKGLFRALNELNGAKATIRWENWVTFLDNMMQVCILQKDSRNLFIPVGIDRLSIHAIEHMEALEYNANKLVEVQFHEATQTMRSQFVEMRGMQATSIMKRKNRLKPVLESYQFVPNEIETNLSTSVRVNMQLLLECKPVVNWPILEVLGIDDEIVLSQEVCAVIEDLPLILPCMSVLTENERFQMENVTIVKTISDRYLLFICKNPDEKAWKKCEKALIEDGFLLCLCSGNYAFKPPRNFVLLTKHVLQDTNDIIYFLRKKLSNETKSEVVDVSALNATWLSHVQKALDKNPNVVLFAANQDSGVIGLTNCLRKETGGERVQCVFIRDADAKCDKLQTEQQLYKQMPINVYQQGKWGTYRHLLLPKSQGVELGHWLGTARNPGELSSVSWVQGPLIINDNTKEKLIKVLYSALNFRDLMIVSGKLTAETVSRNRTEHNRLNGLEFSGIDSSGKRVVGLSNGAISNYIEKQFLTFEVPADWEMSDAASALVVYSTALLAFSTVDGLRKGQTILIHSGAGGVGLCALNICSYYELDIFVTVGTEEKRDYLLQHYPNLKASHIGNSRDISFREMVRTQTNGRGVDIVLNSLAEEKLQASVECLAEGGYFLEIGKYDMSKNHELPIDLMNKQCTFQSIMLDFFVTTRSMSDKNKLKEILCEAVRKGYMKPLPKRIFQMDEIEQAFKFMSTGKHIGKILIQIDHERINDNVFPCQYFDPNCSYVIFGGLGGFGLELSDWLVVRGVRNLILSSRKGITTGYQEYRISIWKSHGVNVVILTDDMTSYDNCSRVLKQIHSVAPIDGIFNLAVVLKDAIFKNLTMDFMEVSMLPKATLTAHLDKVTRELCPKMRHFVIFSSVSCGRGNAGQTNYGYANSVMERICERRCKDGFRGLAIQWGAVGDVGLLEDLQKEQNEIAIGGTLQQKIGNCLQVLDELLARQNIVSSMVVAEKFAKAVADSPLEAVKVILGIADIKSVSPHVAFPELGMDSMMAVEIRQTLERDFDILIGPSDLRTLTFTTLEDLYVGQGKEAPNVTVTEDLFAGLIPNMSAHLLGDTCFVDFNTGASTKKGDFILVFLGIDADFSKFEKISQKINRHMKCVNIEGITKEPERTDIIVNYIFKAIIDEVAVNKCLHICAHSMGSIPAIETTKRFEDNGVHVKIAFIDASPQLVLKIFNTLKAASEDEFHYNVLLAVLTSMLPSLNASELKEVLAKGKDFHEKVDIALTHYTTIEKDHMDLYRNIAHNFMKQLLSVSLYNPQFSKKLKAYAVLYKPSLKSIQELTEDYELSTFFAEIQRIEVFDGNHRTILDDEKMMEQLSADLSL